jgi:hypothetical protein
MKHSVKRTHPKGLTHWEAPSHPRHVDRLSSLTNATIDNANFQNTYTIEWLSIIRTARDLQLRPVTS